jgi:uncharacterized protein YjgD (DUF1641 family)
MAQRKQKVNYDHLIDEALELINTPPSEGELDKLSSKARRAYARTKLETMIEKKRLQAEISDGYEYLD